MTKQSETGNLTYMIAQEIWDAAFAPFATGDDFLDDGDWLSCQEMATRIVNRVFAGEGQEIEDLPIVAAAKALVDACRTVLEDAEMALSGEWDRGDEGFETQAEMVREALAAWEAAVPGTGDPACHN